MRASWVSFPVALLVAAACAVSATVGQVGCSQSSTYVTKDQFPAEYAQALCSSLTHCCAENGVSQDYDQCTKGWESAVSALLDGPQSSGNYDVTAATQCIQAVRDAAGASCQPVAGSLSAARPICQSVFAGQLPLGSPCTAAAQCAQLDGSEVTCAVVPGDGGTGSTSGGQLPLSARVLGNGVVVAPADVPVCVVVTPPEAGSNPIPCTINAAAGTDTCIAQGMYCDPTSLTCQAQGPAGNGCDPSVITSCAPGNYCGSAAAAGAAGGDSGAGAATPILHPEATDAGDDGGGTDGATASDGASATDGAGDDGSGSDATTSDAAPSPEASAGDAGGGSEGGSGTDGGGGAAAGVCVVAGPVGSPCTSNAMCDATGACDATTQLCVALEPPGSACSSDAQCTIDVCDGTTHKCLTNAIATTAACNGSSE